MNDWGVILKHACLALMGGIVREIVNEGQHSLIKFIAGGFVGVFCGLLAFFVCKHWNTGEYMTAVCTGLAGYTGTPLLDAAGKRLKGWLKDK